ncbi:50S ribosomal protein L32 [Patescibacteria group bacterium]|nr:50S ribosomal protein L32 [Patescibacteria group bacterium]
MALPKQKRSKTRQKTRQYQFRLKKLNLSICPQCQKPKKPHQACPFCGTYSGRDVIDLDKKTKSAENKKTKSASSKKDPSDSKKIKN